MDLQALTICIAGLMNLPAPQFPAAVTEVGGEQLQEICSGASQSNRRRIFGCYLPRSRQIYIDGDRVGKHETLAHEIAHDIDTMADAELEHDKIYWVGRKAEVWCR